MPLTLETMPLTLESYQVGWICALSVEAELAELMLDKTHDLIPLPARDENIYTFGQIDVNGQGGSHNIVIARLPSAETGTAAAATVAKDMLRTFTNLKFGLMVGIAGGIWSPEVDVRLGDVVVGAPDDNGPGVVQYDHGKYIQGKEFVHRGILDKAPKVLRTAVSVAKQVRRRKTFLSHLDDEDVKELAPRPTDDILFEAAYAHPDGARSCAGCEVQRKKDRPERRDPVPLVHYGAIASGNGVVKDALFADDVRRKHGILCFEMEAAGLDNFPCLVIRGISDYADTHKNDDWHAYAASTAAAYAKELLRVVPLTAISQLPSIGNKHWLVPRPSTPLFTGRESVLQKMKDHLVRRSDDNRERPIFVCCGMGGSGKSETAIKFVEKNRNSFWGIFWVNADTQDTAKQGFAEIASACSISNTSIEDVKSWLANKDSPWLLVLDNCDTMNKDYSSYFPSEQNGSIIMTTRLPECKSYGLSDDMHKLGPEASSSLLLRACGDKYQDRERHKDAAANVVKLVDELAIALVHAGAYIRRGFCTLQEFPQRFHTQKEHIILFRPNQMASRYGSVYTTFEISAEALSASGDKYDRLALTLLRILAFLDHEGVEEDIFKRALEYCQVLNQNPETCPHVFEELAEADTDVPCDVQPSQLVLEEHGSAHGARVKISVPREMHSLFQKKPRSSTAVVPTENPFVATVDEEPATGQKSCPVSVSETQSLSTNETSEHDADDGEIDHLSRWHCEEFRSTHLFDSNTLSNIEISRVRLADLSLIRVNDKAISLHPLVHEWASIRLSAEERKQAWGQTVCILAMSTEEHQDWQIFTRSLKAHIEACFKDRKNIGYDDEIPLGLARCLYVLACQLYQADNNVLPLELLQAVQKRCLLQPNTFAVRAQELLYCEAACLMGIPGRTADAVTMLEKIVSCRLEFFGADDINTRRAQHALATCCGTQCEYQKVVDILEPIVARFMAHTVRTASGDEVAESKDAGSSVESHLRGLRHQSSCMLELSIAYLKLGNVAKAVPLLEELVTYRTSRLPSGDPLRLGSMHELAVAHTKLGQNERALPYLEEVVRLRLQPLAPDDSERLISVDLLAKVYWSVNRLQEAINLRENALGLEHGFTLANLTSGHSPWILRPVSEYRGKIVGRRERIQSNMMHNLAVIYLYTNQVLDAKALLEPVVDFRSKFYSLDDPERLRSMRALAITYIRLRDTEELDEAIRLLEQVISNGEKLFESDPELRVDTEEWLDEARDLLNSSASSGRRTTADDEKQSDQGAEISDNEGRPL